MKKSNNFAIKNITVYLLIGYAIGYLLLYTAPDVYELLIFSPDLIINKFQIWRLFTWIITVPESLNIFTLILFYMCYYFGTTLEKMWGTKKYNIYILSGLLFTVVGGMLIYFILPLIFKGYPKELFSLYISSGITTYYINMSIFLAFNFSFPDTELLLYFLIKIKAKYIGYIYLAFVLVGVYDSFRTDKLFGTINLLVLIFSLMNLIIFKVNGYLDGKNLKDIGRQNKFKRDINKGYSTNKHYRHKCCVCKRTDYTNPELEFRFCSKCSGNKEYCMDHLFRHEHK